MKVYFGDLGKDFIHHYFKLFAESPAKVAPIYSPQAELQVDSEAIVGSDKIVTFLPSLGSLTLGNYIPQPYGSSDVLITAGVKSPSVSYVMTFVLSLIGEDNRFGITYHLIHRIPQ
jgi:hypothetical protein